MTTAQPGPCEGGQVHAAAAPDHPLSAARKRWVLAATVLGSSLTFIDGSALGVALPAVQRDLAAGTAAHPHPRRKRERARQHGHIHGGWNDHRPRRVRLGTLVCRFEFRHGEAELGGGEDRKRKHDRKDGYRAKPPHFFGSTAPEAFLSR